MSKINKKVKNHLELSEIEALMREHRESYEIYRRLLLIRMVTKGQSISKASENLNISRKTGERWIKKYNEKGVDGLFSDYSNCGRKSYLSNEQLEELRQIIIGNEENFNLKDVKNLIEEKYGIQYSEKQIWVITRKKLGLNYGKPFIEYNTRPENPKDDLKKN